MAHGITQHDSMFSVRQVPWHGLGKVLDAYPQSIEEALEKSGLGWTVKQGGVYASQGDGATPFDALRVADEIAAIYEQGLVVPPAKFEEYLATRKDVATVVPAKAADGTVWRANLRADTGHVLGIVTDDYTVVDNIDAFRFLDALIMSDMHFETAGSYGAGRKVWVLARLPEFIEVGGDTVGTYMFVANAHDGSMAVTAGVTPVRIVCRNTFTWALSRAEVGAAAARTFRFRHTGDLTAKFEEARKVMGLTVNYEKAFKAVGDKLALEPFTKDALRTKVLDKIDGFKIEDDMGDRAKKNREANVERVLDIFAGKGTAGDTTGNAPGTKWCAVNAVGEWADWNRRYTKRTNQMQRSFEDGDVKQRALELVAAA